MDESLWWVSGHVISVLLFCSKSTESIQFTQWTSFFDIYYIYIYLICIYMQYIYILYYIIIQYNLYPKFLHINNICSPRNLEKKPSTVLKPKSRPLATWKYSQCLILRPCLGGGGTQTLSFGKSCNTFSNLPLSPSPRVCNQLCYLIITQSPVPKDHLPSHPPVQTQRHVTLAAWNPSRQRYPQKGWWF